MLRVHLLQQWYDLSNPAMKDALIEVATMRRFAGIALFTDRMNALQNANEHAHENDQATVMVNSKYKAETF